MKKWINLFLVLIIAGYFGLMPKVDAWAASAVRISDENLVASAHAIVTGRVTYIESHWDADRSNIYTDISIQLDQVIKGNISSQTIVIEQVGGKVGDREAWLTGSPSFKLNEDVLLFLRAGENGTLHTAHLGMGKFTLSAANNTVVRTGEKQAQPANSYLQTIKHLAETTPVTENVLLSPMPTNYSVGTGEAHPNFVLTASRFFEPDSSKPVVFSLNSVGAPNNGGTQELNNAITAWNGAGSRLRLMNGGTSSACGMKMDGKSTISFTNCFTNPMDDPISGQGIISAVMVVTGSDFRIINGNKFNQILEADILFNSNIPQLAISKNLEEVMTTDLGLGFGLDYSSTDVNEAHPLFSQAIMYITPHFDSRGARLNTDDLNAVNSIYSFFPLVRIINNSLPGATLTVPYAAQLSATDGFAGYTFAVTKGMLPGGLSLSKDGTISGTPTMVETQTFDITATDAGNFSTTRTFMISTVALPPRINSISPARVRYNGDSTITITGMNFTGTTAVNISTGRINGFKVIDNNTIMIAVSGPGTTGQVADITVVNPGGTNTLVSGLVFDGPFLKSAKAMKITVRNSKGTVVNKKGIEVIGDGLSIFQQIKINGTMVTLTAARDGNNQIVYFGTIKPLIPRKGTYKVTIFDPVLNSESNAVDGQGFSK